MEKCNKFQIFDEKLDIFLDHIDPLYHAVPAPSFGFAAVIISVIAMFISFFLYVSVEPSFTIFTHWISHLGAGPNGSSIVFNIGISITSVLLFLFYMYYIKEFRKRGGNKVIINLFFLSNICTCSALFLVAFLPYNIGILHAVAAFTFFISGLISSILYAILILITKGTSKIQALFSFITTFFFCFHLITGVIIPFSTGFDFGMAKLTEWLTLFAMLGLIIEVGIYHIIEKRLFYKKIADRVIDTNRMNPRNIIKLRKYIKALIIS